MSDVKDERYGYDSAEDVRTAFYALAERQKELDGEPDGSVEVVVEDVSIKAVEENGEVRIVVHDDIVDRETTISLGLDPQGAEMFAEGLLSLAGQARGETGYTTRPDSMDHPEVVERISQGHTVDRIRLAEYAELGTGALAEVVEFLEALEHSSDVYFRTEYGETVICREYTEAEKRDILDRLQRDWDRTKELYEEHAEAGTAPSDYASRERISKFCAAEGLPEPWETIR